MVIRDIQTADLKAIHELINSAFLSNESNEINVFVSKLLTASVSPSIKATVAEINDEVVGFISCSPIYVDSDESLTGYILAPLAVSPTHQQQGIGSALVNSAINVLKENNVDVLLVYGDPDYYSRFRFMRSVADYFVPPYRLTYPAGWLGMMLSERCLPNHSVEFNCVEALKNPDLW